MISHSLQQPAVTAEEFPRSHRYERYLTAAFGIGLLLSSAVVIDNIATEDSRCIIDNPKGWVDVSPLECDDVIREFISK